MHSPAFASTDQISGEIHKVGIVLIDELHHGRFQQLVVKLQVLPHLLQLDLLPTICHKLINVEVILKTETKGGQTFRIQDKYNSDKESKMKNPREQVQFG